MCIVLVWSKPWSLQVHLVGCGHACGPSPRRRCPPDMDLSPDVDAAGAIYWVGILELMVESYEHDCI